MSGRGSVPGCGGGFGASVTAQFRAVLRSGARSAGPWCRSWARCRVESDHRPANPAARWGRRSLGAGCAGRHPEARSSKPQMPVRAFFEAGQGGRARLEGPVDISRAVWSGAPLGYRGPAFLLPFPVAVVGAGDHEVLAGIALRSNGQSWPPTTSLNVHRPCSVGTAARSIISWAAVLSHCGLG